VHGRIPHGWRTVDNDPYDDDEGANEHTGLATKVVDAETDEWQGTDIANLVYRAHHSLPWPIHGTVKPISEPCVRSQATEKGAIKTVHCLAETLVDCQRADTPVWWGGSMSAYNPSSRHPINMNVVEFHWIFSLIRASLKASDPRTILTSTSLTCGNHQYSI
jgi:hypothetical protein